MFVTAPYRRYFVEAATAILFDSHQYCCLYKQTEFLLKIIKKIHTQKDNGIVTTIRDQDNMIMDDVNLIGVIKTVQRWQPPDGSICRG